jgi:hypothetical protein
MTILTSDDEIPVTVEIADTIDEQALGLMYRTELTADHGMLFVFEEEAYRTFWMKNTKLPLDILFLDKEDIIVDVKENFEPCHADPCELYTSKEPAMYALEVNAGFVAAHNIEIGNRVNMRR